MPKGKKGGRWKNQVAFDPKAHTNSGSIYTIDDDSLVEEMSELIDDSEKILQIWVYKNPLSDWQLTQLLFNHQFVVLETAKWWWSIEKDGQQILIQRSETLYGARDYVQQKRRITPIEEMSYDKGRKSMKELIEFLYLKDELNKTYHWVDDNCQDFAKRVFDKFAERKYHGIVMGGYSK